VLIEGWLRTLLLSSLNYRPRPKVEICLISLARQSGLSG